MLAIALETLGLAIARSRRALIPVETEPAERVHDERDVLVGGARTIGVLDAQDERPAVMPRVEPVEQRGARAPDVQMPGRAGGESHAHQRL